MEILSIFEHKLKTSEQSTDDFARKWDERAPLFYKGQVSGSQFLPNEVTIMKTTRLSVISWDVGK